MSKNFFLNELANNLITIIKQRTNVFNTINVIVPSSNTEQWFKTYWLKTQNEILMNVKFQTIEQGLLSLIDSDKPYRILKRDAIKALIIKHLTQSDNLNLPSEINDYLYNENKQLNAIKLYDLSNKLSSLYLQYEKDNIDITGWENDLYNTILDDANNYNYTTLSYLFNTNKRLENINQDIYFFGFSNFSKLEERIINYISQYNNVIILQLKQDETFNKDYEVFNAPSKLREIEALHSKICTLLQNKQTDYSDILVLAPDISQYERIIPRVFNQDNVNFPNVAYTINSKKRINTNVSNGLRKLFDIYNKNQFTRFDLFELINNLDIQISRNINEDDVVNFCESIITMNVFRNSENLDDWDYAKKRLLLSKVANMNDIDDNIIELNDDYYLPYTNIEFNNETIVKFVSIIDDLKEWCNLLHSIKNVNTDNILLIKNQLDKWFSMLDKNSFETNRYYKNVTSVIYSWNHMQVFNDCIPLNTLFYMLLDASVVTDYHMQSHFTRGITFADFDERAILEAKYIFFLNASSHEFPALTVKSELDIRCDDISKIDDLQNSFFIQYQNASDKFFISYVNKNLKTDEDYYPSTFITKLKKRKNIEEEKIDLDETRNWNQLFTKKEYKNKGYYLGLLNNEEVVIEERLLEESEKPKKVNSSLMVKFLTEPLAYKTNYLFGYEDTLDEDIRDEYEPFDLSRLDNSILVNKIAYVLLQEKIDVLSDDKIFELKRKLELERKIPIINSLINESVLLSILSQAEDIRKYIKAKTKDNYEIIKLQDLLLSDNENNQVVLTCNKEMCLLTEGLKRTYLQIKKEIISKDFSKYLDLYIFSLIDVSLLNDENLYEIHLIGKYSKSYSITSSEARKTLLDIYNLMNDFENNYCVPIDYYKVKEDKTKAKTFNDLISDLKKEQGPWGFFNYKKLFNYEKDLGYNEENFDVLFKTKLLELAKLVKFINTESDGD